MYLYSDSAVICTFKLSMHDTVAQPKTTQPICGTGFWHQWDINLSERCARSNLQLPCKNGFSISSCMRM